MYLFSDIVYQTDLFVYQFISSFVDMTNIDAAKSFVSFFNKQTKTKINLIKEKQIIQHFGVDLLLILSQMLILQQIQEDCLTYITRCYHIISKTQTHYQTNVQF